MNPTLWGLISGIGIWLVLGSLLSTELINGGNWIVGAFWGIIVGAGTALFQSARKEVRQQEEARRSLEAKIRAAGEGERQKQEAERRRQEAETHAAEQVALRARLTTLVTNSSSIARALPKLIESAEGALDLAQGEFAEGVFAPFWDAVEQAATKLAIFDNNIQSLVRNSLHFQNEISKLDAPKPQFQLGVSTLPDAIRTAERMRGIVRQAQKQPDFAKIYEMRKSNQLLASGFPALGQAISILGSRLQSSLDSLSSSVSIGLSDLATAQSQSTSELQYELEQTRNQLEEDSDATREHERKQREMLDNIQRRRKPLL